MLLLVPALARRAQGCVVGTYGSAWTLSIRRWTSFLGERGHPWGVNRPRIYYWELSIIASNDVVSTQHVVNVIFDELGTQLQ